VTTSLSRLLRGTSTPVKVAWIVFNFAKPRWPLVFCAKTWRLAAAFRRPGTFGDSTVTGILNKNILDAIGMSTPSTEMKAGSAAINASAPKAHGGASANRLRLGGLRWMDQQRFRFRWSPSTRWEI
jgi:hypothetical protein